LLEGFSLGSYLQLADWNSRLIRQGKARVTAEVASILDRLGTSAEVWQKTMGCLFSRPRTWGVAFAFGRQRLQEAAARRGCHHLANLNGCPTSAESPSRFGFTFCGEDSARGRRELCRKPLLTGVLSP